MDFNLNYVFLGVNSRVRIDLPVQIFFQSGVEISGGARNTHEGLVTVFKESLHYSKT